MEPANYIPKPPASPTFAEKARRVAQNFLKVCQKVAKSIWKALKNFGAFLKRSWKKFLRRFTKWIDPKLEPYRTHPRNASPLASAPQPASLATPANPSDPDIPKAPTFQPASSATSDDTPQTRADIFEILTQAPHNIFSQRERNMMTNLLDLPAIKVSEIMLPASKIVYVDADEVLGPLTLDRLYRSGFSHFPVKDDKGSLIGCVHTTHFNNLDIRNSSRVADILDPDLYYVRDDYSLEQALDAFLRTNAFFFLVTDRYGKVTGLLTFNDFCRHLFGANPKDTFDGDSDRLAVATRRR